MKISYHKHELQFNFEAGTSRGILNNHTVYYVKIQDPKNPELFGIGECAPLKGLSIDFGPTFEARLNTVCQTLSQVEKIGFIDIYKNIPESLPSVRFGFETALLDYKYGGKRKIFSNDFSENNKTIEINGLIWMADKTLMLNRIDEKIKEGYTTIKLKIGAIDFEDECSMLAIIREKYSTKNITIRLDANGAFDPAEALIKLERLAKYNIHSIEQPIAAGQKFIFKEIIKNSPIPIALDEELINVFGSDKFKLLALLKPQYIVLKPTLLGGFEATKDWITYAENHKIGWWLTSALESNIGLNAIAQFAGEFNNTLPQGLGTGQLYNNNIESPLTIENANLFYNQNSPWNLAFTE